jgi:hypothetical protein
MSFAGRIGFYGAAGIEVPIFPTDDLTGCHACDFLFTCGKCKIVSSLTMAVHEFPCNRKHDLICTSCEKKSKVKKRFRWDEMDAYSQETNKTWLKNNYRLSICLTGGKDPAFTRFQ